MYTRLNLGRIPFNLLGHATTKDKGTILGYIEHVVSKSAPVT